MRYHKYLHYILLALTLSALSLNSYCQNDTLPGKESNGFYAGASFGNNLIYLGSTISGNKSYFSPSLIYSIKDKLFLSASATNVQDLAPVIAFSSFTATFNKTVNSWFDYSASLGYYHTSGTIKDILFRSFGLANVTTGFDWKLLYTKVSLSGIMSETNTGYVQIRNSHYFQTGQFLNNKAFLSFDPNFSFLFGRLMKTETSTGISKFGNAPPFVQMKKNTGTTTITYSYFFGMMDTELSLPVTLNFDKFSLEAEGLYILPAHKDSEYLSPNGFSLNITAIIKLF